MLSQYQQPSVFSFPAASGDYVAQVVLRTVRTQVRRV